jgi:hypothetical protein
MGLNNSRNLSQAKKTADKWFSLYIRLRDSNPNGTATCITCDKVDEWRTFDCGHFQSRRYLSTRYEEMNAHSQCVGCNQWGSGEQYKHGLAIDMLYGEGTAQELEQKARSLTKMNKNEVMELAREFKAMAEELAEQKGIEI